MFVIDIIKLYLKENGYDGLCHPETDCGCEIDDLIPCSNLNEYCEAGYKIFCKDCKEQECEYRDDKGWCIAIKKGREVER
jgi:hypothetical protein